MKIFKWSWLLTLLINLPAFALDTEHILWEKAPIPIHLTLNEERFIHFPQAISLIDNELADKGHVLKVQDSLYIKAKESFDNKRLIVQLMPQGEIIILNFSANDVGHENKPIDIVLETAKESLVKQASPVFDSNAITLTRFAIQSLYAPQRLLTIPSTINRVPMQTKRQINLFYGASVEAHPLISWNSDSLYVTAVELKNLLKKDVILDPRHLMGNWQTATFYPTNTLSPRGKNDTTTVFLISDRPFSYAFASTREFVR